MHLLMRLVKFLICLPFSAKLKAPLLSLGAAGQIGKALVFFAWKGIDCVREYVVPANPKSAGQIAQRGHMTAAVAEWHAAAYTASDVIAWNRLAGVAAKIMSGFNRMCQEFIGEIILGNAWERLHDVTVPLVAAAAIDILVTKASAGNAPTVHYGTRKTHFPDSQAMVDQTGDVWKGGLLLLAADTLYYFYIEVGTTETDFARTGIYQQRTAAA